MNSAKVALSKRLPSGSIKPITGETEPAPEAVEARSGQFASSFVCSL